MSTPITVVKLIRVQSPSIIVRKKNRKTIQVNITNYDPRIIRIRNREEPSLTNRGFRPTDDNLTTWTGRFKGYPVRIYFPYDYPAVPFKWYWQKIPSGFHNVINNELCVQALLNNSKWTPDLTVETIFESLESHRYFRGRLW